MENILIRKIDKNDIDAISAIELDSFANPWTKCMFAGELENCFSFGYCAEERSKIVGYMFFWIVFDELHIANIAVDKRYRNKKIGTGFIELAIKKGQQKGDVKAAMLEVRGSNVAAIRLYEKLNFKINFLRKNYYSDPKEDACIMIFDLKQTSELASLRS